MTTESPLGIAAPNVGNASCKRIARSEIRDLSFVRRVDMNFTRSLPRHTSWPMLAVAAAACGTPEPSVSEQTVPLAVQPAALGGAKDGPSAAFEVRSGVG